MEREEELKLVDAIVLTPEQERSIDEAMERARNAPPSVHGISAYFDTKLCLLVVSLSSGRRVAIPQEDLQGVAELSPEQAAEFEMDSHGIGIWWDRIDLGFTVEGLRTGFTGTAKWMESLKVLRETCPADGILMTA